MYFSLNIQTEIHVYIPCKPPIPEYIDYSSLSIDEHQILFTKSYLHSRTFAQLM